MGLLFDPNGNVSGPCHRSDGKAACVAFPLNNLAVNPAPRHLGLNNLLAELPPFPRGPLISQNILFRTGLDRRILTIFLLRCSSEPVRIISVFTLDLL